MHMQNVRNIIIFAFELEPPWAGSIKQWRWLVQCMTDLKSKSRINISQTCFMLPETWAQDWKLEDGGPRLMNMEMQSTADFRSGRVGDICRSQWKRSPSRGSRLCFQWAWDDPSIHRTFNVVRPVYLVQSNKNISYPPTPCATAHLGSIILLLCVLKRSVSATKYRKIVLLERLVLHFPQRSIEIRFMPHSS